MAALRCQGSALPSASQRTLTALCLSLFLCALLVPGAWASYLPVTNGGNIGIGTTTASQKLEVIGTVKATAFLGDGSGLTNIPGSISALNAGYLPKASSPTTLNDSAIYQNLANIGIGSTGPGYKLDVAGSAFASGTMGSHVYFYTDVPGVSDFLLASTGGVWGALQNDAAGTWSLASKNTFDATLGTPALSWTSTGLVGIGSTAPQARLDVEGGVYVGNGNVGIGSANPVNKLDVTGIGSGAAGIHINDAVPSSTNMALYNESGTLKWNGTALATGASVSGTQNYLSRFTSSSSLGDSALYQNGSNIGIGSTAPQSVLDVNGTVRATAFIGDGSGLTGLQANSGWIRTGTNVYVTTGTDNVGIGSSVPQTKLDVQGTAYFNGNVGIGTTSPSGTLEIGSGQLVVPVGSLGVPSIAFGGDLNTGIYSNAADQIQMSVGGLNRFSLQSSYVLLPSQISFISSIKTHIDYLATDNLAFTTNNLERIRIQNDGNVGMGSSAPQAKLDVEGSAYFGNGNIGVGSSVPSQKIDVLGTVKATAFIGDGSGLTGLSSISGLTPGKLPKANTSSTLNDSNLYQDVGGNVGIGTTVPQAKLEVYGGDILNTTSNANYYLKINVNPSAANSINFSGPYGRTFLKFENAPASSTYNDVTTLGYGAVGRATVIVGNVGIGSTSPQTNLDVLGTAYFSGNIGIGSTVPATLLNIGSGTPTTAASGIQFGTDAAANLYRYTAGGLKSDAVALYLPNGVAFATSFAVSGSVSNGVFTSALGDGVSTQLTAGTNGSILLRPNNTEAVRIISNGNVGINSTVPQAKLDVEGGVYVGNGNIGIGVAPSASYSLVSSGNINVGNATSFSSGSTFTGFVVGTLQTHGNLSLQPGDGFGQVWIAKSNTAPILVADSATANVGINSTAPQAKLDVEGSVYVGYGNIGVGSMTPTQVVDVVGTVRATAFIGDGSALTGISTGGWSRVAPNLYPTTITDNVGIGSSAPNALLNVKGASSFNGIGLTGNFFTVSGGTGPNAAAGGSLVLAAGNAQNTMGTDGGSIALTGGNGSAMNNGYGGNVTITAGNGGAGATAGILTLNAGTGSSPRILLGTTSGNVGMGSSVPQAKLDVEGSVYVGNGNVGIGSSAPQYALDVNGRIYSNDFVQSGLLFMSGSSRGLFAGSVSYGGYSFIGSTTSQSPDIYSGTSGYIRFDTGTNDAMRIATNGNVGINSTVPQATLDVEGSAYFGNGNIGVGSSVPSQKIDVLGTVKATAFIGDGSQLSGISAGSSGWSRVAPNLYPTTITDNVGIGSTVPRAKLDVEGNVYFGNGNVGIGTNTLTDVFNVYGNVRFANDADNYIYGHDTDHLVLQSGDSNGTGRGVILRADTDITNGVTNYVNVLSADDRGVTIGETSSNFGYVNGPGNANFVIRSGDVNAADKGLRFQVDTNPASSTANYVEIISIPSSGNVGIGSTAPQVKLDVEGNIYIGNGNIGIGSSNPDAYLDVKGSDVNGRSLRLRSGDTSSQGDSNQILFSYGGGTLYTHALKTRHNSSAQQGNGFDFYVWRYGTDATTDIGTRQLMSLDDYGNWQVKVAGSPVDNNTSVAGIAFLVAQNAIDNRAKGALVYQRSNTFSRGDFYFLQGTSADNNPATLSDVVMTIANNGNVGIASTAPQAKLDVEGNIYVGNGGGSGGNVGIGSIAPVQKLDVVGTVKATSFIGDGSQLTGISAGGGWSRVAPNLYPTTITDNVGIGSSAPRAKLDVRSGNIFVNTNGAVADNVLIGDPPSGGYPGIWLGAAAASPTYSNYSFLSDGNGGNLFNAASGQLTRFRVNNAAVLTAGGNGVNIGGPDTGTPADAPAYPFQVHTTSDFVINSSGNVGINSITPQAKLDVEGGVYVGNGNVGIGTTNPSVALHVIGSARGNVSGALRIDSGNGTLDIGAQNINSAGFSTDRPSFYFNNELVLNPAKVTAYNGNDLQFGMDANPYNGTVRMVIKQVTGNVGINSSAPQAKLDVEGSAYFGNGNIGVGSSVPTQKIDVIGTVKATAFIGDGSGITGLGGGGLSWNDVAGTSTSMAVNNGYIADNAGLVILTLPASATVGSVVRVTGGVSGACGWKIAQNSGQAVHYGSVSTTSGAGGYLTSSGQYDSIELLCVKADTDFVVLSSVGNINYN